MKRCLNCMEEYEEDYDQCPLCHHRQESREARPQILKEGSILQGRYIVGVCRRIRDCDITYIGWDALFDRKIQIQEFFPIRCAVRAEGGGVSALADREELYKENLVSFEVYHKNLIRLYKQDDIISVFSCFKDNGTAYAVTQYSDASTLGEWIEKETDTGLETVLVFLYQALEAVKKVHSLGLVHGAIRLGSFWITADRKLVLKDFAEPCHYCGAPSLKDYQDAGPWTDIYGLSMLFGKMLIGWEDVTPTEILEYLADGRNRPPVRMALAIKGGLGKGKGERIRRLDEFYDMIFSNTATMRLITGGEKNLKKNCAGKRQGARSKRRILVWSMTGMAVCFIAMAALLTAKQLGWI